MRNTKWQNAILYVSLITWRHNTILRSLTFSSFRQLNSVPSLYVMSWFSSKEKNDIKKWSREEALLLHYCPISFLQTQKQANHFFLYILSVGVRIRLKSKNVFKRNVKSFLCLFGFNTSLHLVIFYVVQML